MTTTENTEWTTTMILLEDALDDPNLRNRHLAEVLRESQVAERAQLMYDALCSRAATTLHMQVLEGTTQAWIVEFLNTELDTIDLQPCDEPVLMEAFQEATGLALGLLGYAPSASRASVAPTATHVHCAYALVRMLEGLVPEPR